MAGLLGISQGMEVDISRLYVTHRESVLGGNSSPLTKFFKVVFKYEAFFPFLKKNPCKNFSLLKRETSNLSWRASATGSFFSFLSKKATFSCSLIHKRSPQHVALHV